MNIFQKILYVFLTVNEKSLKIRLDRHFRRNAQNSTTKIVISANAKLSLTSQTEQNAELVRQNIAAIINKYGLNPYELLKFIDAKDTKICRPAYADKFLKIIGEDEGFISELRGFQAFLLNIYTGNGFSFKTKPMFVMREGNIEPHYFLHHFYKWYAMKYNLPGFDYKAQKLLKISMKNPNDKRLQNLNLDEMLSLKEAIARDNEASDFVIKLARHNDGSKQVLRKMQDGGANV